MALTDISRPVHTGISIRIRYRSNPDWKVHTECALISIRIECALSQTTSQGSFDPYWSYRLCLVSKTMSTWLIAQVVRHNERCIAKVVQHNRAQMWISLGPFCSLCLYTCICCSFGWVGQAGAPRRQFAKFLLPWLWSCSWTMQFFRTSGSM